MDFDWMQQSVRGLIKFGSWPIDFESESLLDIAASDIADITSRLSSSNVYITQEVIAGTGEDVDPNEYVENGDSESSVHLG